jgi:hypothetical protein
VGASFIRCRAVSQPRRQLPSDRGVGTIRLYGGAANSAQTRATVDWMGDDQLQPLVVGAYFDKILANLTRDSSKQSKLFIKFEDLIEDAHARPAAILEKASWAPGDVVQLVDSPQPETLVAEIRVEVALVRARQRLGAATHFKPARGTNETVAELGLWALWAWTVRLADRDALALEPTLELLLTQCAYYREHGLPGVRDIGKAPYYPLLSMATAMLVDDIAAKEFARIRDLYGLPTGEASATMETPPRPGFPKLLLRTKVGRNERLVKVYDQRGNVWRCEICHEKLPGGLRISAAIEYCETCLRREAARDPDEVIAESRETAREGVAMADDHVRFYPLWEIWALRANLRQRRNLRELRREGEELLADTESESYRARIADELAELQEVAALIDGKLRSPDSEP